MLFCMNLQEHLAKIRAFYRSHKRMPSYSELMAVAGFRSKNAVYKLVQRMVAQDWLEKEATYILKVNGESMIEAGILPGDMLLVERGAEPRDGDIVIAQVDREWTMKYFRRRGQQVFLEAANKDFKPIYPTEELKIAAVVRAVIRKYT